VNGEFAAIARLAAALRAPPPGETWIGDDTAVVTPPRGWLLLATDAVVAGVHADLSITGLDDLGWKAVTANVSDVAAMGGRPGYALVSVAGPGVTDLDLLYRGIGAAAEAYDCPVVGGDLSTSPALVVTVAVTGSVEGTPVRRSGGRPGDGIWCTGPLGGSAAGLRLLRERAGGGGERAGGGGETAGGGRETAGGGRETAGGGGERAEGGVASPSAKPVAQSPPAMPVARVLDPATVVARVADHARPRAALAEGTAARLAGATAMIDVSDGFSADLWHLADASRVGVEIGGLPVARGATTAEALGGGEDYRLIFTAPDAASVRAAFGNLPAPIRVGTCVADPGRRLLDGVPFCPQGWQHPWDV